MDKSVKHQASEGHEGQALDGLRQPLIIAGQAPKPGQPAKAAFSDPATLPMNRFAAGWWSGMLGLLLSSHGLALSRSAKATGSSQWGQRPPGPIRRQNCWHSGQRCSPKYRVPQAGHSYTVAGRGVRVGRGGRGEAWPRRQAAWRQAAEQKRCRPTGTNARPQRGQGIVTLSLRYGLSTISGLRPSGLGPPAPQLVREGPLAEVAEPFALSAVRPHDPAAQACGFLPGLHPAAPDPVLEGTLRQPELLAQLGAPPFVRAQRGARAGPWPHCSEPQP